jgi:hypothetical protein
MNLVAYRHSPERAGAETTAVEKFKLTDEQRKRLLLREQLRG